MTTHTQNKTGRTVAVISGGVFLAWLLWRGRGKGTGSGDGSTGGHPSALVTVRIRSGDRLELDGASADLAVVIARARAAGTARVFATGDARHGWITQVIAALKAADVAIEAAPSLLLSPERPRNTVSDFEVRNAALKYRPIGANGEPYPDWIRMLNGKSGVYILRETQDDGTIETVYVGESHTDRLYQTLTRHFQTWRRAKKFWTGQYTGSQSHDPGLTYDRERITVAVRVLPAARALAEEARLIARLRPRDNLRGQPVDDDPDEVVPF